MQPHISNGTCSGLVVIDITKDSDTAEVPIVLDINNITISQAQGKCISIEMSHAPNAYFSRVKIQQKKKYDLLLCCQPTRHSNDILTFFNSSLSLAVFQTTPVLTSPLNISTEYGENRDTYIIRIKGKPIAANETLQVKLKFISQLSNTLQGFYRVAYEDDDSNTKK